jgi:hypothetical protein
VVTYRRERFIVGVVVVTNAMTAVAESDITSPFQATPRVDHQPPYAQVGAGLNVPISAGVYRIGDKRYTYAGGSIAIGAAPGVGLERYDLILLSSAGVLSVVVGTAAAAPANLPSTGDSPALNDWPVAIVKIVNGQTQLTEADIQSPLATFGALIGHSMIGPARIIRRTLGGAFLDFVSGVANDGSYNASTNGSRLRRSASGAVEGPVWETIESGVAMSDRLFLYNKSIRSWIFSSLLRVRNELGTDLVVPSVFNYVFGTPNSIAAQVINFTMGVGNETNLFVIVMAHYEANTILGTVQVRLFNPALDGFSIFEPTGNEDGNAVSNRLEVREDAAVSNGNSTVFLMGRIRRSAVATNHRVDITPSNATLKHYSVLFLRNF